MRLILRVLAALLLAPLALALLLLVGAAAIAGLPLLWEAVVRTYTAPPREQLEGQ